MNSKRKKLKIDKNFSSCSVDNKDELYANGIFEFNVTKMLEFIRKKSSGISLEKVPVSEFSKSFSSINESHIDSVDISQPVILVEISPGKYNLIDGNHRMEKARRMGKQNIFAYRVNVEQHINFLTETKAYKLYVEYWNSKLR